MDAMNAFFANIASSNSNTSTSNSNDRMAADNPYSNNNNNNNNIHSHQHHHHFSSSSDDSEGDHDDDAAIAYNPRKKFHGMMRMQKCVVAASRNNNNDNNNNKNTVNVDDFLAEELNQLTMNERTEIISVLKETVETDEKLSLAKELNKMSLQEREHILHDIHGVASPKVQETPELIHTSLVQLHQAIQVELGNTSNTNNNGSPSSNNNNNNNTTNQRLAAYRLAMSINPDYVQNPAFCLLFLRATEFDCHAAACRMIDFFTFKLDLFGRDLLCRDVTMNDLSKQDLICLQNAHMQLLPSRDQAGRAIMAYLSPWMTDHCQSVESMQRAQYYQIMTWLGDEASQKNGFVIVLYRCGRSYLKKPDPRAVWKNATSFQVIPFQIRSWHLCAVDYHSGFLWPTRWLLEKRTRIRTRVHQGSHVECMYHLMTFGIPIRSFPVSDEVELKTDKHLQWIESMKKLEANHCKKLQSNTTITSMTKTLRTDNTTTTTTNDQNNNTTKKDNEHSNEMGGDGTNRNDNNNNNTNKPSFASFIPSTLPHVSVPSRNDILFGRGKPIQEHPGNIRLGVILESLFDQYEALRRSEKTSLAQDVVVKIKNSGGRFLKQVDGGIMWEEVDDDVAREKVSHTFRSLRSAANKSSSSSSSSGAAAAEKKKKKTSKKKSIPKMRSIEEEGDDKKRTREDIQT